MKKYKFLSVLFVLLLSFACLVGCSNNAKGISELISNYDKSVESLVYVDASQVNSAVLHKSADNKYYYEFQPYDNANLRQAVTNKTGIYAMLSNDSEYFVLINHASKYQVNKYVLNTLSLHKDKFSSIPSDVLLSLDNSQQDLIKVLGNFKNRYSILSKGYQTDTANSQSTKYALIDLLKEYKNLIATQIDMSLSVQQIVDNYLLFDLSNYISQEKISYAEIYRLIDAYELYITDYLFQRYVVLETAKSGSDYQLSFKDNELLVKLNSLMQKLEDFKSTNDKTELSNSDAYKYLMLQEQSMRARIQINRTSVKNLNGKIPQTSDSDYEYKNTIYQDLVSYQDTLLDLVSKLDTLLA